MTPLKRTRLVFAGKPRRFTRLSDGWLRWRDILVTYSRRDACWVSTAVCSDAEGSTAQGALDALEKQMRRARDELSKLLGDEQSGRDFDEALTSQAAERQKARDEARRVARGDR
jgi:hypothetical protein